MGVSVLLAIIPNEINRKYLARQESETSKRRKRPFFFWAFLILIYILYTAVAGVRYYVGTDYTTYILHQIPIVLSGTTQKTGYDVELLYRFVIKLGVAMGSIQWIFVLTHVILMAFIIMYIMARSRNYMMSLCILILGTFYNFSLNGMRQAIATAVFLFATQYIVRKKMLKYFLFIFVAYLFHKSAIVYFPFYFLTYFHFTKSKKFMWLLLIITPLTLLSINSLHQLAFDLSIKYNFYSKFFGSVYDTSNMFTYMYVFILVVNVIILITCYLVRESVDSSKSTFDGESLNASLDVDMNIQVIATIFSVISFAVPGAFRVFYMFIPIQMTLIPNIIVAVANKKFRMLLYFAFILLFASMYVLLILWWNQNETLPYQTIFNN